MSYRGYTDAQGRAAMRYRAKALARIELSPQRAEGERIRRAAAAAGMSVQGYILSTLRQRMDADGVPSVPPSVPEDDGQETEDGTGGTGTGTD